MRLILSLFVVLAWASGPVFGPKAPTLTEPLAPRPAAPTPTVAAETPSIDFDHLRSQARDALNQLRQSQATRRMAMASTSSL